jgi:asparagine synthase (glutamine-hydrolysing)
MCGIAALLRLDGRPVDPAVLARMSDSLIHRGPDGGGVHLVGPVGLGFRRLAILDLSSAANQPMASEDGGLVLVFNGEIFNYVELRAELAARGHRFRSTGDTEVLLHAYQEWGRECLPRLNGMWAFLIHDRRRGVLFGARDRFGIKPLYRYRNAAVFCAASEIKAIRASGTYRDAIDWERASNFLHRGALDEGEETLYTGICQVPPGTAFEADRGGRVTEWRYWSLDAVPLADVRDPIGSFRDLFEESVRLRMRSDVPVGVCLSGGLDSGSIICAAARERRRVNHAAGGADGGADGPSLQAFCYMSPEFDESPYIDDLLAATGAEIKRLETGPEELWERLPDVLAYHDEPVYSMTALVGFELMRLASRHGIRVVLNGQGADETAAGYFSYFRNYWRELVAEGRLGRAWREIGGYAVTHEASFVRLLLATVEDAVRWRLSALPSYRQIAVRRRRRALEQDPWFRPDLTARSSPESAAERRESDLAAALKHSVARASLPLYLRVEDRNSMAHSVEARLPFLDYRLVALLFNLEAEWKLRGGLNKFVLREAMRGRIPESVRGRKDKMGFPIPARKWFARELYAPVRELLTARAVRERGIYDSQAILRDLEAHRRGEMDVSDRLFRVVQFEQWIQMLKVPAPAPARPVTDRGRDRRGIRLSLGPPITFAGPALQTGAEILLGL